MYYSGLCWIITGGSAWESNPPETVLAPHTGFEGVAQGIYGVWYSLLVFVTVSKLYFKAQYHLAVLCLFLSWSLYIYYTGEGETGNPTLPLHKESITVTHTKGYKLSIRVDTGVMKHENIKTRPTSYQA